MGLCDNEENVPLQSPTLKCFDTMSEVTIPLHALSWICVTTQFLGNYPFTVTIPKVFNTLFQNTSNYHYFRRLCTVTGFCDISGNHPLQKAGVKNFSTFLPHCIKTRLEFCSVAIHDAMPVISKYKQLNVFEIKNKQTRGRPSMHEVFTHGRLLLFKKFNKPAHQKRQEKTVY